MLVPTLDLSNQALAVAGTPSRNVGRVQSARTPIVLEESDTQVRPYSQVYYECN